MANPDQQWWEWGLELFKVTLLTVSSAGSGVILWFAAKYRSHVAMLNRHEEHVVQAEKTLGELVAFKKNTETAPTGSGLNKVIEQLKETDEQLHRRVSSVRREQSRSNQEVGERLAKLEEGVEWIKEGIKRIEGSK